MLLALDIGNTHITAGVFNESRIIHSWRLSSDINRTEDELGIFIKNLLSDAGVQKEVKAAVISSVVVQLTDNMEKAVIKYLGIKPLIVSHKIKMNIELKTDNPRQIGADRIANACAAAHLYPAPSITVDLGTAASFDVLNSRKEFIGGIITAGMKIQAEALSMRTSKLPKLHIEPSKNVIGRNTIDAMLSGIVRGQAAMIDGLIEECEKELGEKAFIIAAGGYSDIVSRYMKRKFDCINPDLTLTGLKILYDLNM